MGSPRTTSPPSPTIPGVLLSIAGRGVLLTGDSGSGKSEAALGLLERGHRLVADDAVTIDSLNGRLRGRAPARLRGLLEVRGLGLLDVPRLYGPAAVAASAGIELEIELQPATAADFAAWPRLQPRLDQHELLGCRLPRLRLPLAPGRAVALLVETAVRQYLPAAPRQAC